MGVANVQGEDQKKLDVLANDLFINMLKSSFEVSGYITNTAVCAAVAYITPLLGGCDGIGRE